MPDVIPMQMTAAFWRGKAQRAQRSGDLPEAIRLYRAALRVQESSGVRRELAQVYADAHCFSASERLYLENLAADAEDTDSLYGLARTRSMAGDRQEMADLLDLYLRISPCGEQADHARDILWDMPRSSRPKKRMRRAETLLYQAEKRRGDPQTCQKLLRRSWRRGHTPMAAQMLCRFSLQSGNAKAALRYAQDAAAMYNEENAFIGEDEEADPKKIAGFIRNNYKTLGIDANRINEKLEEDTLKYSEITSKEAGDTGAEVDSLQEMLEHNLELEQKIIVLQEKLSVSHAEESRLVEEVADLKDKVAKLSKVSKENKALKEKIKKVEDSSTQLNESLGKNSSKVQRLTEQLNTVIKERNTATHELESLKEEYASLEKDSQQMNEQLATKVENQNKLLEKYQKITKGAVDRYINLQATNLGVRPVEIRNKLPEKFSFSDVDSICEELRDYKLNVSKLPFATSNSLREGNVRVNNLSRGLTPKNEMDELNDIDLKLMELFK